MLTAIEKVGHSQPPRETKKLAQSQFVLIKTITEKSVYGQMETNLKSIKWEKKAILYGLA